MNASAVFYPTTPAPIQETAMDINVNNYRLIARMFPNVGVGSISAPWFGIIKPEQGQGRGVRLDAAIKENTDLVTGIRVAKGLNDRALTHSLEKEFEGLAATWKRETRAQSSLGEIFTNDSYQRILGMGREALPMILADLQRTPGHWFYALEKIVGRDIAADAKTFAEARALWLEWGYRENHI